MTELSEAELDELVDTMIDDNLGAERQAIAILDLRLPVSAPPGSEWIAASRRWAGGQ